jgi:hypothetical protein
VLHIVGKQRRSAYELEIMQPAVESGHPVMDVIEFGGE